MLTSSVINIESRMLPIAVLDPTPTTTALALPATTTVPCKIIERRYQLGTTHQERMLYY